VDLGCRTNVGDIWMVLGEIKIKIKKDDLFSFLLINEDHGQFSLLIPSHPTCTV
jgi:hypothetical protein